MNKMKWDKICPVCGCDEVDTDYMNACANCGFIFDTVQMGWPDCRIGENILSLNEYKEEYERHPEGFRCYPYAKRVTAEEREKGLKYFRGKYGKLDEDDEDDDDDYDEQE